MQSGNSDHAIDAITADDKEVILHLVMGGEWLAQQCLTRIAAYVHFIHSGQLERRDLKYVGRLPVIVVHAESEPSPSTVAALSRTRDILSPMPIGLRLTVGRDLDTYVPLSGDDA